MAVTRGKDGKGPFFQAAPGSRKNYYEAGDADSRAGAKAAAEKSSRALRAAQTRRARKS